MGALVLQDNVSCCHLRGCQYILGRYAPVDPLERLAAAFSHGIICNLLATSGTKNYPLVQVHCFQHPHHKGGLLFRRRCLRISQEEDLKAKSCSLAVLLCVLKVRHFNQHLILNFEVHSDCRDHRSKAIHHLASEGPLL